MNRIYGAVMAAGLVLGPASAADAQFSLSIGNPYTGSGVYIGQPYGYGYGYGGTGTTYYGSGYSGYVAPGTTYYGSGYSSYVAPGTTYFSTGTYAPAPYYYGVAPRAYVPYRNYGYRTYRRGFGIPFLGRRW